MFRVLQFPQERKLIIVAVRSSISGREIDLEIPLLTQLIHFLTQDEERSTVILEVVGSSPTQGTFFSKVFSALKKSRIILTKNKNRILGI